MKEKLTLSQWKKERDIQEGICPWCKVQGFYRYWVDGKRHYKLCKWCGMLQNVGEKPKQCILIQCKKDGRHRYWTIDPKKKRCVHCGGKMEIVKIQTK